MNQEMFDKLDEVTDKSIKLVDKVIDDSVPKVNSFLDKLSTWLSSKLESAESKHSK